MLSKLATTAAALLMSSGAVFAQADPDQIAVKVRFDIHESGNFGLKTLKELGTKEAAVLITTVCAVFGVDCSKEADGATKVIRTMVVGDKAQGEEHHGIYRSPVSYTICRAKIDMKNASIDGESSFSGEIVRDAGPPVDDGLGFYAVVPKFRPEGHSVKADLYLLFVKANPGALEKHHCWPRSTHSDADHLWIVHNGNLQLMKPEAHYP